MAWLGSTNRSISLPPSQVVGVSTTVLSSSSIKVNWSAGIQGVATYTVARNGVPIGTTSASTFTLTDTGLNSSTTYTYTVAANNAAGQGLFSYPATGTTTSSGTGVVWVPGNIGRTGSGNSSGMGGGLATVLSFINSAIAADINNQLVGFMVPAQWANLEGPSKGVYDGSWGGSQAANLGYAGIQQIINLLKSFAFKRYLYISLNQTGNGAGANTNAAYPANFAPSYLNNTAHDLGCEWGGRSGYTGYPNVNTTLWNSNTAQDCVDMVAAYYNHFGPFDPATGNGIYAWELTNEISLQTTSHISSSAFVAAITNQYSQLKTLCPHMFTSMRPTFINNGSAATYKQIMDAMFAARIANANEDGSNNFMGTNPHVSWNDQAYAARGSGPGVGQTDYTQLNTWTHIFNVENAEYGRESTPLGAVPPANVGSGYIQDVPVDSGIMGGANLMNSSHVIWFLDTQDGPNVNRFKFPVTSGQAPNPPKGPGAGLTTARPHLIDVITGNTAQPGITGPVTVPNIIKPTGW